MGTLIDRHTGLVNLSLKQGEKPKYKPKEKDTKEIQICLNCDRPECKGNCKKIKEERYGTIY
jgi:radical SAM protein with 4Fe4S-binding SPASM domain